MGAKLPSVGRAHSRAELAECFQIRTQVFVDEQGIDAELEKDGRDPECEQWLVQWQGMGFATGRIRRRESCVKLERIAVLRKHRGQGYGRRLVERMLVSLGRSESIEVSAQRGAIGFWLKLGFEGVGAPYQEAGLVHQRMLLASVSLNELSLNEVSLNERG